MWRHQNEDIFSLYASIAALMSGAAAQPTPGIKAANNSIAVFVKWPPLRLLALTLYRNLPLVKYRSRHEAFGHFLWFSGLARGRAFHFVDCGTGLPQTNISFVAGPDMEGLSFSAFSTWGLTTCSSSVTTSRVQVKSAMQFVSRKYRRP